ncbi:PREDICTED: U1 small nuclear ribonucleoprotein 70 kDa-like [Papilio polytes]|uniref:U1 small nuclear ribonucleoprotein 70 kDa-like n=1 Tax=Papilio polytes TaxID=76194 RepID=UPI00067666B5|nr:PREDICTED: U1 small nuclear ribonucleoprotein 70 kDa-like [Papilio polytes]
MTQFLPPNLLALFAARDPIPYLPPAAKLPHEKKQKGYDGVGGFLEKFELPSETPPPTRVETREERMERRRRERAEQTAYRLEQEIAMWDPAANPASTTDPFKTLFVARINYDTSESKLRREFEGYGPIKRISMVYSKENGKPRGYAFIEYEHERDMHCEYTHHHTTTLTTPHHTERRHRCICTGKIAFYTSDYITSPPSDVPTTRILSDYPQFRLPPPDVHIKQEPAEEEDKYNPEEANGDHYDY